MIHNPTQEMIKDILLSGRGVTEERTYLQWNPQYFKTDRWGSDGNEWINDVFKGFSLKSTDYATDGPLNSRKELNPGRQEKQRV